MIPDDQYKLYEARRYNDEPVLIGYNSDEGATFGVPASQNAYVQSVKERYASFADKLLVGGDQWVDLALALDALQARGLERVLCEGPFMGDALVRLGCPREKIRIHHLGIETDKIVFVPRRWNSGTPLRVLIAATFTEKKGVPDALEALGRIAGGTKIEITVIGDARPGHPRDQRELARIRRTIDTYGMSSIVQFLG